MQVRKSFSSLEASPRCCDFMHLMGCRYVVSSLHGSGHLFPVLVQEMPVRPSPTPSLGTVVGRKGGFSGDCKLLLAEALFEVARAPGNQLLFI